MSNSHDHDLHQDQLDAGAERGAKPSLGPRSRTAYGHRDWAPMRPVIVRAIGTRALLPHHASSVLIRGRRPPLVARLNKGLLSLISARFGVEH